MNDEKHFVVADSGRTGCLHDPEKRMCVFDTEDKAAAYAIARELKDGEYVVLPLSEAKKMIDAEG